MTFLSTLKKAAQVAGDVLTTKGDLLSRSSSALARLAVGTNDQVLTCASGETTGLKWATAGGGVTLSTQQDVETGDESTTNTSYVATALALTVPNRTGGLAQINVAIVTYNGGSSQNFFSLYDDGSIITSGASLSTVPSTTNVPITLPKVVSLDGSAIALYWKVSSGTGIIRFSDDQQESKMESLEIS